LALVSPALVEHLSGKRFSDVALKIGHAWSSPSKLSHEYDVYTTISGSAGISDAEHRKYVSGDLSSNQTDVLRVWEVRLMLFDGTMTHTHTDRPTKPSS
jgi:hypothetical protein